MAKPPNKRLEASQQRRDAILDAALDVFATSGFSAARLDDVADKAGVAKGTIYLSFKDKEDLFEQILLRAMLPALDRISAIGDDRSISLADALSRLFDFFETEVLATPRRDVIRLVLSEGHRFPRIAATYHKEIVSKGAAIVRRMAKEAHARGELASDDIARFPYLVVAPLLFAVAWEGLFGQIEPLDTKGLLAAHHRLLLGTPRHKRKRT